MCDTKALRIYTIDRSWSFCFNQEEYLEVCALEDLARLKSDVQLVSIP